MIYEEEIYFQKCVLSNDVALKYLGCYLKQLKLFLV